MTKKVLVAERLADAGLAVLRDKGYEVDVKLKMPPEELIAAIPAYDALIVRSATKVTREVIEAGKNLRIIGRAGVGVDNVDVEAATERGVIVCNAPTSNIVSAAEHTLSLIHIWGRARSPSRPPATRASSRAWRTSSAPTASRRSSAPAR